LKIKFYIRQAWLKKNLSIIVYTYNLSYTVNTTFHYLSPFLVAPVSSSGALIILRIIKPLIYKLLFSITSHAQDYFGT